MVVKNIYQADENDKYNPRLKNGILSGHRSNEDDLDRNEDGTGIPIA